jgi:hypothetical protein
MFEGIFYANDWYQKIVRQGIYYKLPADDDAGGTLNFFDIEGKRLKIFRSLKPFGFNCELIDDRYRV